MPLSCGFPKRNAVNHADGHSNAVHHVDAWYCARSGKMAPEVSDEDAVIQKRSFQEFEGEGRLKLVAVRLRVLTG
ncbi:hypothetical protein OK016_11220 [Vibrio chagasii]|nr:hypothetical protein [Vibrio chagasii]